MFENIPILSILCYLPLLGAISILWMKDAAFIRKYATGVVVIDFLLSLPLWFKFDRGGDLFQFVEGPYEWIPSIGVSYHFGIDGVALLLVLLTTLLGVLAFLSSWSAIANREKEYYVFMLLLQTGMLGVFMAMDFFLFYVFWEVMLVPMYFLIGIWGGPRRLYAAIKFFLYTLAGSVLMLLGILALYFYNSTGLLGWGGLGNAPTFSILKFHEIGASIPPDLQFWVFLAFFVGFAIKVPMFPFHTWLPDAHVEAPTAGSVILAGVLLKMGTYGFVRFSLPILPAATVRLLPWMAVLSIIGIVYGALVAMAQKDMKKLVAYSSVSHLGFVMLGIFALNGPGLNGGILQMINHGLSTGALFLLVGIIYERRHTRMIAEYGGISAVMPVFATIFLIITMSSIGLPALNGFIGEFTILVGAFNRVWWWALFAALGIVLGAAYMLWLYQRVFFGPLTNAENKNLKDLSGREFLYLIPIVLLCFWIGIYPKPFFQILEKPVNYIITKVDPSLAAQQVAGTVPAAAPAQPAAAVGE
jgi:NADH-quinone oxidoreductase subunit M